MLDEDGNWSRGARSAIVGLLLTLALMPATGALAENRADVCFSTMTRALPSLQTPYKLILKQYDRPFWGEWEKAVNAEVVRQVAELNARADSATQVYTLAVDSRRGMRDRVGRVIAAGVICPPNGTVDQCRNRNFWGHRDIDPVVFADTVLRNTLANQPSISECKRKQSR